MIGGIRFLSISFSGLLRHIAENLLETVKFKENFFYLLQLQYFFLNVLIIKQTLYINKTLTFKLIYFSSGQIQTRLKAFKICYKIVFFFL